MPKFARSKAQMVAAGVIPIDRLTDMRGPVEVLAQRVGRQQVRVRSVARRCVWLLVYFRLASHLASVKEVPHTLGPPGALRTCVFTACRQPCDGHMLLIDVTVPSQRNVTRMHAHTKP
jgi:hypothetical protein